MPTPYPCTALAVEELGTAPDAFETAVGSLTELPLAIQSIQFIFNSNGQGLMYDVKEPIRGTPVTLDPLPPERVSLRDEMEKKMSAMMFVLLSYDALSTVKVPLRHGCVFHSRSKQDIQSSASNAFHIRIRGMHQGFGWHVLLVLPSLHGNGNAQDVFRRHGQRTAGRISSERNSENEKETVCE